MMFDTDVCTNIRMMSDANVIIIFDSAIIVLTIIAPIKVGYKMSKLMIKLRSKSRRGRQRKKNELTRRVKINVNGIIIIKFCVKLRA